MQHLCDKSRPLRCPGLSRRLWSFFFFFLLLEVFFFNAIDRPNTLGRGVAAALRPLWRPPVPVLKHWRFPHDHRHRRRRRRRLHRRYSSNPPHPASRARLSCRGRQRSDPFLRLLVAYRLIDLFKSGPTLRSTRTVVGGLFAATVLSLLSLGFIFFCPQDGKTPLDFARNMDHTDLAQRLERAAEAEKAKAAWLGLTPQDADDEEEATKAEAEAAEAKAAEVVARVTVWVRGNPDPNPLVVEVMQTMDINESAMTMAAFEAAVDAVRNAARVAALAAAADPAPDATLNSVSMVAGEAEAADTSSDGGSWVVAEEA